MKYNPFKMLAVFVSTEMWERYGFYVVQSLLALLLAKHFRFDEENIYILVGSFTALTYVSPILGGWLADNYLGQKQSIYLGIILLSLSYLMLAMANELNNLLAALAAIAAGTGLLKPNISALLGKQYKEGCEHRDRDFIIFYLGINAGIILGTTIPSKLQAHFGWHVCFISATFGLILAFFKFYIGNKITKIKEQTTITSQPFLKIIKALAILSLTFILFFLILKTPTVANTFFIITALSAAGIVLKIAFSQSGQQRRNTLCLLLLFVISVFFWSFYFQMFTTLILFIAHIVEPMLLGFAFPPPYYVALQSIGILIFGTLMAKFLPQDKSDNVAYAVAKKFTISIVSLFLMYFLIWLTISHDMSSALLSIYPLLLAYLVMSFSELMLSPIGLSAVTKLSAENVVSTMMGIFFVSLGLGGFMSGQLARLAVITSDRTSIIEIKTQYLHAFGQFDLILLGVLATTILLSIAIKKLGEPQ